MRVNTPLSNWSLTASFHGAGDTGSKAGEDPGHNSQRGPGSLGPCLGTVTAPRPTCGKTASCWRLWRLGGSAGAAGASPVCPSHVAAPAHAGALLMGLQVPVPPTHY